MERSNIFTCADLLDRARATILLVEAKGSKGQAPWVITNKRDVWSNILLPLENGGVHILLMNKKTETWPKPSFQVSILIQGT